MADLPDMTHLPIDEKMDYFAKILSGMFDMLGFQSCTIIIRVKDDQFVAARFPACDDKCASPNLCTIKAFEHAAEDLKGQAEAIRRRVGGTTKTGGGYIQ
jgi:hypothetical protein